jgi:hypothetical protein
MIWNPGEGSDLFEGGSGIDTAEVNGGIHRLSPAMNQPGGRQKAAHWFW